MTAMLAAYGRIAADIQTKPTSSGNMVVLDKLSCCGQILSITTV